MLKTRATYSFNESGYCEADVVVVDGLGEGAGAVVRIELVAVAVAVVGLVLPR